MGARPATAPGADLRALRHPQSHRVRGTQSLTRTFRRATPALELDSGHRLVDHPPLRSEGVGEAKKRLLVRKDRATLDPADVALVDAGLLGEFGLGEVEELPSLDHLKREPVGLFEDRPIPLYLDDHARTARSQSPETFVILAVAPEVQTDQARYNRTVRHALDRFAELEI